MSRTDFRPLLLFILLVAVLTALVLTYSTVQTRNRDARATSENLGTQAAITVCATYTARGESPPQCQSK